LLVGRITTLEESFGLAQLTHGGGAMNPIHGEAHYFILAKHSGAHCSPTCDGVYARQHQQQRCKTETLETVTADHAWCEFLRAEYQERLPELKSECERLTTAPDLGDVAANNCRKELRSIRGLIIDTIPPDTAWTRVRLSPEDCLALRLLAYRSWWALSDGSLMLKTAAENLSNQDWVISGQVVASLGSSLEAVRNEIGMIRSRVSGMKATDAAHGLPILIRDAGRDGITIIDGCHRMTAMLVNTTFFERGQPETEAYLGTSTNMSQCRWLAR
jgi:hypothetical protein